MSADALEQVLGLSLGTMDDDYCPRRGRLHSAARPSPPRLRERGGQWGQAQAGAAPLSLATLLGARSPSVVQRTQRGGSFLRETPVTLTGVCSKRCRASKVTCARSRGGRPRRARTSASPPAPCPSTPDGLPEENSCI